MTSVTFRSENVRHVKSQHVLMIRFPSSRSPLRSEPHNAGEEDWFRVLSGEAICHMTRVSHFKQTVFSRVWTVSVWVTVMWAWFPKVHVKLDLSNKTEKYLEPLCVYVHSCVSMLVGTRDYNPWSRPIFWFMIFSVLVCPFLFVTYNDANAVVGLPIPSQTWTHTQTRC